MALLHYEHFDLYGTSMTALGLRGYTALGSPAIEAGGRTGTHHLRNASAGGARALRWGLSSPVAGVIGQGVAMRVDDFNTVNSNAQQGLSFGVSGAPERVRVVVTTGGGFAVYVNGSLQASSANGLYVVASWFWVEAKVTPGTGTGSVQVRVNGVQVINATGLTIAGPFNSVTLGLPITSSGSAGVNFDDWVVWEGSSGDVVDFMGDTFVIVAEPTADTAVADWTASTGSRFSCIDEASPSDADYIQATAIGQACEFTHPALNLGVGAIAAIASQTRAFKSDAGAASYATGLKSGAASSMSAEIALATGAVVHTHIAERNPDGNVPWTQSAANAARLRVEWNA